MRYNIILDIQKIAINYSNLNILIFSKSILFSKKVNLNFLSVVVFDFMR